MIDLRGKRVVVTGAGHGLGRAYAVALGRAGASVVVNARRAEVVEDVAAEIRSDGGSAVACALSVSDPEEAVGIVSACVEEFGGIDALVNNAALMYTADSWVDEATRQTELMTTNVLGSMWVGTAAIRHMISAGGGSIVNTASGSAAGMPRGAAYAGSKAAVLGVTYSWAEELAPYGIRVNAISPYARSRMSPSVGAPPPENVAPLVVWLVSDLSREVTGQNIRLVMDQLYLTAPPRFADQPMATAASWDVAEIDRVFRDDFAELLQPVGPGGRPVRDLLRPAAAVGLISGGMDPQLKESTTE